MLKLWELTVSPNNTKVRMALRFKGVAFEAIPVDPQGRSSLVEVSGQEGTPVIVDKGIVLNDSEAIVQYLDANYRESPRLFPSDKGGRRACDGWKETLDERVAKHWAPPFFYAIGLREDLDADARQAFEEALRWLDDELGERDSFHGPERAICDLRVAEWATYAFPGAALKARVPAFARLQEVYGVAAGSCPNLERFLAPWNERLA